MKLKDLKMPEGGMPAAPSAPSAGSGSQGSSQGSSGAGSEFKVAPVFDLIKAELAKVSCWIRFISLLICVCLGFLSMVYLRTMYSLFFLSRDNSDNLLKIWCVILVTYYCQCSSVISVSGFHSYVNYPFSNDQAFSHYEKLMSWYKKTNHFGSNFSCSLCSLLVLYWAILY